MTLDDLGDVTECEQLTGVFDEAHKLACMDQCLDGCMDNINTWIDREDTVDRVPPTAVVRCAKGGKTTVLATLFQRLKDHESYWPIIISFNGSSHVWRPVEEECEKSLLRHIAHALLKENHPGKATGLKDMSCEAATLNEYFQRCRNQKVKVVLIIDELNMLLPAGPRTPDASAWKAAAFLKNTFLKAEGGYLVFSSHVQRAATQLEEYMDSESGRGLLIQSLPIASRLEELTSIDHNCAGLTSARAAYYGNLPSLVYVASKHRSWTPQKEFAKAQLGETHRDLLASFTAEVLTGHAESVAGPTVPFARLTDRVSSTEVRWIPCYMSPLLRSCGQGPLHDWLERLTSAEKNDGKAWEAVVAVAFGLRYLHVALRAVPAHEFLGKIDRSITVQILDCPSTVTTLGAALPFAYSTLKGTDNCVCLCRPTHSGFELIDLFACWRRDGHTQLLMVAQTKQGRDRQLTKLPPEVEGGVPAWWLNGLAPAERQWSEKDETKPRWTIPSASEVQGFLGPSLRVCSPRDWVP